MTVRNPIEWGADQIRFAAHAVEEASHAVYHHEESIDALRPEVHKITAADLRDVISKGVAVSAPTAPMCSFCACSIRSSD
ncbi:MAG: hypothetical protein WDN69_02580 [Aliidongia sp.]